MCGARSCTGGVAVIDSHAAGTRRRRFIPPPMPAPTLSPAQAAAARSAGPLWHPPPPLLRSAPPSFVLALRRGALLIVLAIFLMFVAPAVSFFAQGLVSVILTFGVQLTAYAVSFVGAWLLTRRDPTGAGEALYGRSRKFVRVANLAAVQAMALAFILLFVPLPRAWIPLVLYLISSAGLIAAMGQFAQLDYLGKLALRLPNRTIFARANIAKWGLGMTYAALMILNVIAQHARPRSIWDSSQTYDLVRMIEMFVALAVVIFGLMQLFILTRIAHHLRLQLALAKQQTTTPAA